MPTEKIRLRRIDHPTPKQNHLLAALPAADYEFLLPQLELVRMPRGWAVFESAGQHGYVYFPATSLVALLYVIADTSSTQSAVVGNDGVVGIALIMGGKSTPRHAVVQGAGYGFRLNANLLKHHFDRGGPVQHLLLRYVQALITQTAQTAACNRHHAVEQQLCRWLLLSLDRVPLSELTMAQDLFANMPEVQREGAFAAAAKLQAAGLIHYSRGKISVLDRAKLEARVCECYSLVKREYERLLSPDVILASLAG